MSYEKDNYCGGKYKLLKKWKQQETTRDVPGV